MFVDFLRKEKAPVIIDVRPAYLFNSKDTIAENNVGRMKGAINIPYDEFKGRITELTKYKSSPILVYSASGDGDGSRAATDLTNNEFTNVNLLLAGINDFIASLTTTSFVENGTPFTVINPYGALKLLNKYENIVVFDTRDSVEYNNKLTGRNAYKNLGHIKNAIHTDKKKMFSVSLTYPKNAPILIYGNEESTDFAYYLHKQGYKKIFLLSSYYDFVFGVFNIENCKDAKRFLTNHSGFY